MRPGVQTLRARRSPRLQSGSSLISADSKPFLPYGRQSVDEEDVQAVLRVMHSDYLTTGPEIDAFEAEFAAATGSADAVSVCNGTVALQALYAGLDIGPGDEVIVPATTFAATSNAALYLQATPVFSDVRGESLLMDPASAAACVTDRTRAIVAVDFTGQPCDYDALQAVADAAGVPLLSDACHALGGSYYGRPVGSLAHASTFSLHPVKPITSGEGGMITTDDPDLAARMRVYRNHGIQSTFRERAQKMTWEYDMTTLGHNFRLSDIHAALGRSQLHKLPDFITARRRIADVYRSQLAGVNGVVLLPEPENTVGAYHLFVVRLPGTRDQVFEAMRDERIGVNVHYKPVYLHSYYQNQLGYERGLCPEAERAYDEIMTLPVHARMTEADALRVVETLTDCLKDAT